MTITNDRTLNPRGDWLRDWADSLTTRSQRSRQAPVCLYHCLESGQRFSMSEGSSTSPLSELNPLKVMAVRRTRNRKSNAFSCLARKMQLNRGSLMPREGIVEISLRWLKFKNIVWHGNAAHHRVVWLCGELGSWLVFDRKGSSGLETHRNRTAPSREGEGAVQFLV
jgi:hypothetical protein